MNAFVSRAVLLAAKYHHHHDGQCLRAAVDEDQDVVMIPTYLLTYLVLLEEFDSFFHRPTLNSFIVVVVVHVGSLKQNKNGVQD